MSNKFKSLLKDTSGNYAMMTALIMAPIVGGLALSVDVAEMSRQRSQVLATLDATNVATARYLLSGVSVDTTKSIQQQEAEREAKIKAFAKTYFRSSLPSVNPDKVALETTVPGSGSSDGLKNKATLTYKPYFWPVAVAMNGMSSANTDVLLPQEAQVSIENTVELAMVLDNSGSMKDYGKDGTKYTQRRIELLRTAAKNLVERLAQRSMVMKQIEKPVQISLVPFAGAVNVDPSNATAGWMDTEGRSPIHHENFTWPMTISTTKKIELVSGVYKKTGTGWPTAERNQVVTRFSMFQEPKTLLGTPVETWQGCVEARPYPMNINDTAPSAGDPASLFVPMFAPDETGTYKTSTNSWWDDNGGSTNAEKQARMNKYFTPKSLTGTLLGDLAWNVPKDDESGSNGYRGPNYTCTVTPTIPLTDVANTTKKAQLMAAIDKMKPLGSTNVPEGMAWGWRTLSPGQPFAEGRPYGVERNLKVLLVLTDGANTYYTGKTENGSTYGAYGYTGKKYNGGSQTRLFMGTGIGAQNDEKVYTNAMNSHFEDLCANAKASDVIVMTVALELNDGNDAEKDQMAALKTCSSDSRLRRDANGKPEKLFWNSTLGTLQQHFNQIADELSNLRITG